MAVKGTEVQGKGWKRVTKLAGRSLWRALKTSRNGFLHFGYAIQTRHTPLAPRDEELVRADVLLASRRVMFYEMQGCNGCCRRAHVQL